MAISREKKQAAVATISDLLGSSKLTVFAYYDGLTVTQTQDLRRQAQANQTAIKVVKNRLFKVALSGNEQLKHLAADNFTGQLLYAFNANDEVAPAKDLSDFAQKHPALKIAGAFNAEGNLLGAEEVHQLAKLPSKDQLRAQLVGTINAPVSGFVNVLAGNLRGLVQVLHAHSQQAN